MEAPDSNKAFPGTGVYPEYCSGIPALRVVGEGGKGRQGKMSGRNMHPVMQKTNIVVIQRFTHMTLWGENAP
jgi:hypothetical protein